MTFSEGNPIRRTYQGHSPEVDRIYQDIQTELLSIPGHATYFAEELERKRQEEPPGLFEGAVHAEGRAHANAGPVWAS